MNKNLISLTFSFLICLITFSSCEKGGETDLSGTYKIKLKETQNIANGSVTFTESEDSRCPINANCVSAGYARVTLAVKDSDQTQNISLCLGDCPEGSKSNVKKITLNGQKYIIQFSELGPYPVSSAFNSIPQPTATIILSKIGRL